VPSVADRPGPTPRHEAGEAADRALSWRLRAGGWSALAVLLGALLVPALVARLARRRKGLVGLAEKLSGDGPALPPGQLMVHGVSLGEVNLMRPLVPLIESRLGASCLLTTTTETGRAQLDSLFPAHQRAFLPFDLPWAVRRFLARARPRLVVLLEFELWPLFLCACHAARIPVVVVNAKISERSYRRFRVAGSLVRPLFAGLTLVMAQNALWGARLLALGVRPERLRVTGSMKADIVVRVGDDAARAAAAALGLSPGQPVLLLASTSAGSDGLEEEAVVLNERPGDWSGRGWRVVVCPRHPERGAGIAARLGALGAEPRRSSLGQRLDGGAGQLLIVDEIGRLAALYAWTALVAGIAVVGGSLGSGRGGQNMLEAAAHGCCTAVGPDTRNFPDAMELLRHAGGVVELGRDGPAQLLLLAGDPERRRALGAGAQRAWAAGRGAMARAVAELAARFPQPPPRS
jgi:3-deoxy-D-manno-octulosonic-acid transferase